MGEADERERGEPAPDGGRADAAPGVEDNSLGRLLTLTDGVFAIALTLLALDLTVPDLTGPVTEHDLVRHLAAKSDSYWSYLLTFYVIAQYWLRHRQVLKRVTGIHPRLIRDTLALLLIVAAMPFPASLLGRYATEPITLVIYGTANALAMLVLILTSWDLRQLGLTDGPTGEDGDYHRRAGAWLTLGVFILCIPAGLVLGQRGPWVLILLAPAGWLPALWRRRRGAA